MDAGGFEDALARYETALRAVVRGDSGPSRQMWSHQDDVTLANPIGPTVRGFAEVAATADRAISQLRDGEGFTIERISAYATEDLGYVHWIERVRLRIPGGDELRPTALRVTAIFRREDGAWRLIHRHADPIPGPRPIDSIITDGE